MPATAGRVRMPANNRVHSSAALQTHGIWQSAIGYDPYAPTNNNEKDSKPSADRSAVADGGEGGENAYASFQGLLALARITGTNADDTRGACKKCGRVGHLTFQCRNFLSLKAEKDESVAVNEAAALFHELKKSGGRKEEESEEEEEDESSDSDSDLDPEIEKIIAARNGKKGRSKKRSRKRSRHSEEEEEEEEEERRRKRKEKRRKEGKRRRTHRRRDDSDDESDGRCHHRKRSNKRKEKDDHSSDSDRHHKRRRERRADPSSSDTSDSSSDVEKKRRRRNGKD